MADNYLLTTTLIANTKAYVDEMNKAKEATKEMDEQVQKSEGSTGKFSRAVGVGMTVAGTAITAVGVKALKSFGDFEQGLNTAAIIAGGTSKDIEGLSDVALKMGQDLPLSAQDSANAMIEMARNGASIEELKNVFPAIAMASTAAGADLSATATVVQQAMNVWGDSLESPEQAAALLTQSANLSNASIESMQQALATMGPTASSAGMELSDTATAIGLLTNKGTSSAEAAQQLRHAMLQMQAPSKGAAEAMDELGLSYRNADGTMKPFTQIAKETSKALDGVGDANKTAYLKTLFHTSGMQAMRPLMEAINNESGDAKNSWEAYAKAMDEAGGSTKKSNEYLNQQAYDMQNNTGASLEKVGGAWDTFSINSMKASKKTNTAVLGMVDNMITWAGTSDDALAKVSRGFVGFSPYIGAAMSASSGFIVQAKNIGGAIKGIASVTGQTIGAIGRFGGKLLGMNKPLQTSAKASESMGKGTSSAGKSAGNASPKLMGIAKAALQIGAGVGIAAAGIGLMVFAITQLAKSGTDGVVAMAAVSVGVIAMTAAMALMGATLTASAIGLAALAAVLAAVGVVALGIGVGIGVASQGMANLVNAVSRLIPQFVKLTAVADKIPVTMRNIGIGAGAMITAFVTNVVGAIPKVIEGFGLMLKGIIETITTNAPLAIKAFYTIIEGFITEITTRIPSIVGKIAEMLLAIIGKLIEYVPQIVAKWAELMIAVLQEITKQIPNVAKAATDMIISFLGAIADNYPEIMNAGVDMIIAVLKGIGDNVPKLIPAAIDMIGKFLMGIANNMYKLYETGKKVVLKVIEGIGQIIGDMFSSGGQILDAFIRGFQKGFDKSNKAGKGAGNETKDGVGSISLDSVGSWLMQGLLNGITGKARELYDTAAGIANNIKDTISSALHIGSPSKDMIKIGAWTTEGLAIGLDKEKKLVSRASDEIAELARIEPVRYDSNFEAPRGMNMRSVNDLNISLDESQVQPANIHLSLGGRDFTAFVGDISNELGSQARLSSGNSVY